ncbi:MAG: right-handed parallel beta-helix repeat-containing protein [Dermabacter sp.]|nr:right-handed parallel beta-helix repeat-containing protein [Dermabacter sp.]
MRHRFLALITTGALIASSAIFAPIPQTPVAHAGPIAPAIPANDSAVHEATPGSRIVFQDDFSSNDGAGWTTSSSSQASITFADGAVHVKGGGPENRMMTKRSLNVSSFTFSLDLSLHEGNSNSAIKVGFLADSSGASRFQITYDGPNRRLKLERVDNGATTVLAQTQNVSLGTTPGHPAHRISIRVEGDSVTASIDGAPLLHAPASGVAQAQPGHILIASQYPKQDYSVDNVEVTTIVPEQSERYSVELATSTDGTRDSNPTTAGGTISASRTEGAAGDSVTLHHSARPGYTFTGYQSFLLESGASTDGLLTFTDGTFTLDDKTGSVLIVATFETLPEDPHLLFQDTFDGTFNGHGHFDVPTDGSASVSAGELRIAPTTGPSHLRLSPSVFAGAQDYRIELDVRKATTTPGTTQIAFRGEGATDRYVLALNGSKAILRRLDSHGNNVELTSLAYVLDGTSRTLSIAVTGPTVSVTSNGAPLISYTNTDTPGVDATPWSNYGPALSLINMTPGSDVAFDNVSITRAAHDIELATAVVNDGAEDPDRASGSVSLSTYTAQAGQTVSWEPIPKGGFTFVGMDVDGQRIHEQSISIPHGAQTTMTFTAHFAPAPQTGTATYYIDSAAGSDANDGLTPESPRATLPTKNDAFSPGDTILIKNGSAFHGPGALLAFSGSGTAGNPISVSTYGDGPRPQLNGDGAIENVVELSNQEHISISGLEITNTAADFDASFSLNASTNTTRNLRGVNITAHDFGVVHGISLTDLYLHDINGNLRTKWNGGIFFDVRATVDGGKLRGIPTKYHGVRIEGNTLERIDRSGIKLVSSDWANQSLTNSPHLPLHWYPSTDVVVRDNSIRYMGGDAITVRDTDGALVEYNLARHSRYQDTGYNAGIWPFQATNTVVQFNEVSHTHGVQDGQGLDADHVSAHSVIQYNYSHNNEGGFVLIMNGFPHTAPTIRYNVSQNDADKTFEFSRGTPAGTAIYNNTVYSETHLRGPRGGIFDLANSRAGTGNREVYIFNNSFHFPAGQKVYAGEAATMQSKIQLFNNAYDGGMAPPAEEQRAITGASQHLPHPGSAPSDGADSPLVGVSSPGAFAGYVPGPDSPLIDAGVSIDDILHRYGGTATDRRSMSPTQIHELAREGRSIDFLAGHHLPDVPGATYSVDFLGAPLPGPGSPGGITIGAIHAVPDGGATPSTRHSPDPSLATLARQQSLPRHR